MSVKQYLKMADAFTASVTTRTTISANIKNGTALILHGDQAEYAAHAINSHDELVAENERLVSVLWEVDRVLSEMQKNGVLVYGLDDLIDEVSHSIQS